MASELFWGGLVALVAGVWFVLLVTLNPKLPSRPAFWGAVALLASVVAVLAPFIIAPRAFTIYGLALTVPPALAFVTTMISYVGLGATALTLLTSRHRFVGLALPTLYALTAAKVFGGYWTGHGLAFASLIF